jgi:hypothetical protein
MKVDPQDWHELLREPPRSLRLTYTVAPEQSPDTHYQLALRPYGQARLDYHSTGLHHVWVGEVEASVVGQILTALRMAGFPVVPTLPVWTVPNSVITRIDIATTGLEASCQIELQDGNGDAACRTALQLLQSIVAQLSEESVSQAQNQLAPVLRERRKIQ